MLKQQNAYTLHKITRKKFLLRKITTSKSGFIASCDLADVSLLSRNNKEYKYILLFIDVFSRFAQAIPLKRKDANTVHDALKKILSSGYFNNLKKIKYRQRQRILQWESKKKYYREKILSYTAYLLEKLKQL